MAIDPMHPEVPRVVLDTNVVLDWLVFRDARCQGLSRQIEGRHLVWLSTDAMREEIQGVLTRPALQRWKPDGERILSTYDRLARHCARGSMPTTATGLVCADADDQKFVDLACHAGARWLFSRDRAVLELAVPARRIGLEILKPEDWHLPAGGP